MTKFDDFLKEQMNDQEFKTEYEALEPGFSVIQALINARKTTGISQKQLAKLTGIHQADISKLENGSANPSLKTLQRIAAGMGMKLKIAFVVPNSK